LDEPSAELPVRIAEMPCIRCGHCADVCPAQLQPHALLRQLRSGDFDGAESDGLFDCTECGRCDPVCPSRIPLLQVLVDGKLDVRRRAGELAVADAARERYQSRQRRLQREAAQAEARLAERRAQVAGADAVAAALARAKARREAKHKGPDS
jgi:electron transport complex protein RnfC